MIDKKPEIYKAHLSNGEFVEIVNRDIYDTTISEKKRRIKSELNRKLGSDIVTAIKFVTYLNTNEQR